MTSSNATAARGLLLVCCIPWLASCDDDWHDCRNCQQDAAAAQVGSGLVAGNFSGNGSASLIATSTTLYYPQVNPGNLAVYLANGSGFAAPTTTPAGDDPLYLAAADLNGDTLPDVVSASYSDGTLTVFFNTAQSPGVFGAPLVLSSPGASQVAIADMNADGLPDLISADYNVSLFVQTSPGVFANPVSLYTGGANWVAVGDLNGDGIPDVALTDATGVKVLLHTGAASATTYAAPAAVFQTSDPHRAGTSLIAIADVNGDGLNDLIITDPGPAGGGAPVVAVLLQNPSAPGTFAAPVDYPSSAGSTAQSLEVADVNGDALPDIIIGGSTQLGVLLQNPASRGTFAAVASTPVSNASQIAVADVNGDGLADLIVPNRPTRTLVDGVYTNTPGVLLQNAAQPGTFAAVTAFP